MSTVLISGVLKNRNKTS